MTIVQLDGVSRRFGIGRNQRVALQPCSFRASGGEIVGLVGPNGAGKTTLLRLIAGELTLTAGELLIDGNHAGSRQARRIVGYAPDPPIAPNELTGVEWLKYLASHRAAHPGERVALLQWAVELADLEAFVGRRIAEYSRGMMQRLGLAAAAVCGNSVLALDEGDLFVLVAPAEARVPFPHAIRDDRLGRAGGDRRGISGLPRGTVLRRQLHRLRRL